MKETVDRVKNRRILTYDSASNVVIVQRFGPVDESASAANKDESQSK
ncbi:MAG: hypothetical protein V3T83_14075 [Acidobacteriota bacterium]